MFRSHVLSLVAGAAVLAAVGCGKPETGASPGKAASPAPAAAPAEVKLAPYAYPAPVKGGVHEINIGRFDLVDGVAYAAGDGSGTVLYASSKPIASPILVDSPCPMTEARSLNILRNGSWAEVTADANGRSKYFGYGTSFAGSGFDKSPSGRSWTVQLHRSPGRVTGAARHERYGGFSYDLPFLVPQVREVSEMNRSDGRRPDETAPRPDAAAVTATFHAVREAALSRDLKKLLSAEGFSGNATEKIRGLDGVDADVAVFSDRFLQPDTPGEVSAKPGTASVRVEGTNSKGKKFANYYHLNSCGSRLVLVAISENPQ